MPLSDEAASEEVQLALAALTNRFSIVTSTETLQSKQRGEFILAHLECGCRCSEQFSPGRSRWDVLQAFGQTPAAPAARWGRSGVVWTTYRDG